MTKFEIFNVRVSLPNLTGCLKGQIQGVTVLGKWSFVFDFDEIRGFHLNPRFSLKSMFFIKIRSFHLNPKISHLSLASNKDQNAILHRLR